jgi:hypothetical protein
MPSRATGCAFPARWPFVAGRADDEVGPPAFVAEHVTDRVVDAVDRREHDPSVDEAVCGGHQSVFARRSAAVLGLSDEVGFSWAVGPRFESRRAHLAVGRVSDPAFLQGSLVPGSPETTARAGPVPDVAAAARRRALRFLPAGSRLWWRLVVLPFSDAQGGRRQVSSVLLARISEAAVASLSSISTCAPPESTNG